MKQWVSGLALVVVVMLLAGCAKPPSPGTGQAKADKKVAAKKPHSEWWCEEHGIPEEECSMCQYKVAKAFKDKGDWCKVHPDRAASQCFICNPEQAKVYAAKYRAKYNKEPPSAPENMPAEAPKKDDAKKEEAK